MRISAVVAALLAAAPALAGEGAPPGVAAVEVGLGERIELCGKQKLTPCPVVRFICDDPKVAVVELAAAGKPAVLVGVGAGRTLCAVYYGPEGNLRRLLDVAVGRGGRELRR